jgi:hypothetical protein
MLTRRKLARQKSRSTKRKPAAVSPALVSPDGSPVKRKRGRPRKYPRPNDPAARPSTSEPSSDRLPALKPAEPPPRDWSWTYAAVYPPPSDLPAIDSFPASATGHVLLNFQTSLISDFAQRWWSGSPIALSDETDYVKYSIIGSASRLLGTFCDGGFPTLVITTPGSLIRWFNELRDWSHGKTLLFKQEKKASPERFYTPQNAPEFDILVITRDQLLKDSAALPKLRWSLIVVDDLTSTKATYHQSLVGLGSLDRMQLCFVLPNLSDVTAPDFETICEFVGDLPPITLSVTVQSAVEAELIEESIYFCQMTAQQTKLCQQLFSANRKHLMRCNEDRRWSSCLCQLMKQLRLASTHPFLIDGARQPLSENPDPQSGKFKELMRVLTAERQEDRKIVIICGDIKTVQLVHHSLNLRGLSHTKFDLGTRPKQQEKVARQFNMTDGFAILIIPTTSLEVTLPLLNADSLLAFGMDWLPSMNTEEVVRWYRRTAQCQPRLLRLISQQSIEQVLFELFWEDRSLIPARFELGEDDVDNRLVITCLMKLAVLLSRTSALETPSRSFRTQTTSP